MNVRVVAKEINDIYILSSLLSKSICYFNTVKHFDNNWYITLSMLNHIGERNLSELKICNINRYEEKKISSMMCFLNAITTDHNCITLHTYADSIRFYVNNHHIELTINEDVFV